MIRLIRIGGQILEGNEDFAFWDTVRDRFVDIYGDVVWHDRAQFEESCALWAGRPHRSARSATGEDIIMGGFERLRGFLDNAPWIRATTPDDD